MDEFDFAVTRMDPTIRDRWLEGLESGFYPQGRGQLHVQDEGGRHCFCPLGVLADLSPSVTWVPVAEDDIHASGSFGAQVADYRPECFELPFPLIAETGLAWDMAGHIACANDEEVAFVTVARFIRQHL